MRRVLFWIIGILLLLLLVFFILRAIGGGGDGGDILNGSPTAVDDNFPTAYETAVSKNIAANDTDPDGDALTVSLPQLSGPTKGTLTAFDPSGAFTYTPNAGYSGTDQFEYQICDPGGECDNALVTITIAGIPTPPDAIDDMFETMKNTAVSDNLLANDIGTNLIVDPDQVTGLVVQPNGDFTYTPEIDFSGTITFSYKACDTVPQCDSAMVTIVVFDFQLVPDSYTATKNTAVSENVLDNDIGTVTVSTTLAITPTNGIAEIQSDGKFTYTPSNDYVGADTFTYQACNATSNCGTAVVSITVGGPQLQPDSVSTLINEPVSGNVLDNDSGDGLNVTNMAVITPTNGMVTDQGNGNFTYTPNTDFEGTDMFTYKVCDSDSLCATAKVTIDVTSVMPPVIHTVVYGEWLLQIARCYGTTPYAIRAHNYIPYPDIIYPEQKLYIPNVGSVGSYDGPPCIQEYIVKTGDTLAEIAAAHNITESELARVNGLYTYHYYGYYYYGYGHHYYHYKGIYAGQKLIVPRPVPDYMQPIP